MIVDTLCTVLGAISRNLCLMVSAQSRRSWQLEDKSKFLQKVMGYPSMQPPVSTGRTLSRLGSYVATYHWKPRVMSMGFVMTHSRGDCSYHLLGKPVFLDERHTASVQNGGYTARGIVTRSSLDGRGSVSWSRMQCPRLPLIGLGGLRSQS